MSTEPNSEVAAGPVVGRNEPCPCRSGKKYKRCCGISAAPKLSAPSPARNPAAPAGPNPFENMGEDQMAMMAQMSQALQRLPKGQMARLQGIMQKAMAGKDVTRESQEFEKTLPLELQQMMRNFQMPGMPPMGGGAPGAGMGDLLGAPASLALPDSGETGGGAMSAEDARKIVEEAVAEGKLTSDQAKDLLAAVPSTEKESKLSKFFKFGKK
jgi:hypothetical protein